MPILPGERERTGTKAWGDGARWCPPASGARTVLRAQRAQALLSISQTSSCRSQFSWLYGHLSFQVNKDLSCPASVPHPTLGLWEGHV